MSRTVRWLAAVLCAVGLVQAAEAGFGVGGKLWMIGFDKETGMDDTIMFGPKAEWVGETFWLSGMVLFGSAESEYTDEYGYTYNETMDLQDGEVVFGASFSFIDIGAGLRHTTWSFKEEAVGEEDATYSDSIKIWGPMVYIGAGSSFGESPLGWYAGVSYMFKDLGDLTEEGSEETGEHYNVELGLSLALDRFSATAGYRQKTFLNYVGDKDTLDLTQKGVAISASFNF